MNKANGNLGVGVPLQVRRYLPLLENVGTFPCSHFHFSFFLTVFFLLMHISKINIWINKNMRCFCDGLIILISYMYSFPPPSIFLLPVLLSKAHAPSYIYIYKLSLSIPSLNPCFLRSAWRFLSTPTCRGLCPSQMNQCFSYIIFSM